MQRAMNAASSVLSKLFALDAGLTHNRWNLLLLYRNRSEWPAAVRITLPNALAAAQSRVS
jgi:hypothetical protein